MRLLQVAVTDCRRGSPIHGYSWRAFLQDGLGGRCYYKCGIVAAGEATSGCSLRLPRWWPCPLTFATLASGVYRNWVLHRVQGCRPRALLGGIGYPECGTATAGEATSGCSPRLPRWLPCLLSLTTLASDFYQRQVVHRTAFSRHCRVDVVTSSVV